jgi:hypothetical protein
LRLKYEKIMNDPLKEEMIDLQLKFYQPYQNLLSDIEQYIVEEHEDEEENEDCDKDASDTENSDLNLETTEIKDIKDFIKSKHENVRETGLLEKDALLEQIALLNSQQRLIFDDVVERLASGDFEENPFLLYIRYLNYITRLINYHH